MNCWPRLADLRRCGETAPDQGIQVSSSLSSSGPPPQCCVKTVSRPLDPDPGTQPRPSAPLCGCAAVGRVPRAEDFRIPQAQWGSLRSHALQLVDHVLSSVSNAISLLWPSPLPLSTSVP